ncbi:MAG: serine--tRNA ligase, partial [Acidobacteriota bacterium]|nr:serine--tRNA ligase [Acidobacteriota bacterium]
MIDARAARNEPVEFRRKLARKGAAEAFDAWLAADEEWRRLVPIVDMLRAQTKFKGKPTAQQQQELRGVKEGLQKAEQALTEAEAARDALGLRIPNPPADDVPDGSTEDDVREERRVGEPPRLDDPKDHLEIGRFDMDRAARMSGARFGYWIGDTARLALALYRYALDRLADEGFVTVLPPVLVREQALVGTGAFPSDEVNVYELEADGLYLAGTAEIPLASLHAGEILDPSELPLRYVAFSPCFRREAGAAGRDTRGMFRVHQFNKVE